MWGQSNETNQNSFLKKSKNVLMKIMWNRNDNQWKDKQRLSVVIYIILFAKTSLHIVKSRMNTNKAYTISKRHYREILATLYKLMVQICPWSSIFTQQLMSPIFQTFYCWLYSSIVDVSCYYQHIHGKRTFIRNAK